MTRFFTLFAMLALVLALAPAGVAAGTARCSVSVDPAVGGPTDVYRIHVTNVPVDPDGGSVEFQLEIRRLGSREGSVYWVFLVPGVTEFYVDHNAPPPGEPPTELAPGRYLVSAHVSHDTGCYATARFVVEA